MKKIIALVILVMSFNVLAYYEVYVHIIDRKGVNNNFTLTDELHSVEPFVSGKDIRVEMKNGIVLKVKAELDEKTKEFKLNGVMNNKKGKEIGYLQPVNRKVKVGDPLKYVINDKEQQIIEVTLRPIEK